VPRVLYSSSICACVCLLMCYTFGLLVGFVYGKYLWGLYSSVLFDFPV